MEQKEIEKIGKDYQELKKDYFIVLGWNDPAKKDELVIVSKKPKKEVMAAAAKGTTLYELIDLYGGVDGVQKVFPGDKSMYGDFTGTPETFSPEELELMAAKMNAYAKAAKAAKEQQEKEKGETGGNNPEERPQAQAEQQPEDGSVTNPSGGK